MEAVQTDLAGLEQGDDPPPTLGVSGEIRLAPDKRQAFLDDLRATLQDLFTRHGGADGDAFRLAVACYPRRTTMSDILRMRARLTAAHLPSTGR